MKAEIKSKYIQILEKTKKKERLQGLFALLGNRNVMITIFES